MRLVIANSYLTRAHGIIVKYIIFETIHEIFVGPMGIIPKVRNTQKNKKCMKVSHKQFGTNKVRLLVKRRLHVFYVQHLVD